MAGFAPIADLPIADVPDATDVATQSARINIPVYDPRYMSIGSWSTRVAESLLQFGYVTHAASEQDWQKWAQAIVQLPALTPLSVPDPRYFSDWTSWAFRFNDAILRQ